MRRMSARSPSSCLKLPVAGISFVAPAFSASNKTAMAGLGYRRRAHSLRASMASKTAAAVATPRPVTCFLTAPGFTPQGERQRLRKLSQDAQAIHDARTCCLR